MEHYVKIPEGQDGLAKMKEIYEWFYSLEVLKYGVGEEFEQDELEMFAVMLTLGYKAMRRRSGDVIKRPDFDYTI